MGLRDFVLKVVTQPTPEALWQLYGQLLALGADPAVTTTVQRFHHYLIDLQSKASARQYSELASLLDIGAVGGVALQNLTGGDAGHMFERLMMGTLSESLMVLASRQYIKAWQSEITVTHAEAVWFITGALWRVSEEMRPDLAPDQRWAQVQGLLAPASDPDADSLVKSVLLGRLFLLLLLIQLLPYWPAETA